jgi:ribosome maturation factor RimP
VRIDRPDNSTGSGVTVDDCATISRELEQWLDATGTLGTRYILEVSSPGIERPVRWREHWVRFVGRDVLVRLPGRGRLRATILGVPDGTESVVLKVVANGEEVTVPLAEARDARLAVDWGK